MRVEPMCYGVYRFVAGSEPEHADLKAAWLSVFPKETAAERLSKRPYDAVIAAETAAASLKAGDFHMSPYTFITSHRRQTSREDMRFLRSSLDEADVIILEGVPTTSPERTVFDLLRLDEDPSLVDGFMRDLAQSQSRPFDLERLSELLDPIAARHGFPDGGVSFAADLMARNVADVQIVKAGEALQSALSSVLNTDALSSSVMESAEVAFAELTRFEAASELARSLQSSMTSLYPGIAKSLSLMSSKMRELSASIPAAANPLTDPDADGAALALRAVAKAAGQSERSNQPTNEGAQ